MTLNERVIRVEVLLQSTLGSVRDYSADDLKIRMNLALAFLTGTDADIEKAAAADVEMQRQFDENGERITYTPAERTTTVN